MNLIRNYRNWRRYRETVTELGRLSNRQLSRSRHRPRARSRRSPARRSNTEFRRSRSSSPTLTDTVSLHLLPRVDQQNGARRTSSRGGRCFPKGLAPFIKAKGISSMPTSSQATTDTVGSHLLPRVDRPKRHPSDLLPRRVLLFCARPASPDRASALRRRLLSRPQAIIPALMNKNPHPRHRRRPRRLRSRLAGGAGRRSRRAA